MAIRKEYNQSWNPFWLNMPEPEIPIASEDTVGGVKIGEGLEVENDGTLNTDEMPIASAETLGGVKIGNGLSIDANGVLSAAGGAASVEKVLTGALDTRLNGLIQAYGDGTKILCDYIEYPMYISSTESGEQDNAGAAKFNINGYVSQVDADTNKTYGRATVMIVDGNVGKSKHYEIDPSKHSYGQTDTVYVRFTNVEIDIQKQQDDSYRCYIYYDKVYLVPTDGRQIGVTNVEYNMTNSVLLDSAVKLYEVTSVSNTADQGISAQMIDITPAMNYTAENYYIKGKFKSLVTVSADLQTFTWAVAGGIWLSYPKQSKNANGWFLQVVEELTKAPIDYHRYAGPIDGYVLSCSSNKLEYNPAGDSIAANLNACTLVRYVTMSDGIVLIPDAV